MSLYTDLEEFVLTHRPQGDPTWRASEVTEKGYTVWVTCPCGVVFERWVLPRYSGGKRP